MQKSAILNGVIVAAVIVFVLVVGWYKSGQRSSSDDTSVAQVAEPVAEESATPAVAKAMPRFVDLGAHECKACKEMAPILKELQAEYEGRAIVEFIDVWKNPEAGQEYSLRLIPTQIFYDRQGKEVWRHEGFLSKGDIVAKLAELGA